MINVIKINSMGVIGCRRFFMRVIITHSIWLNLTGELELRNDFAAHAHLVCDFNDIIAPMITKRQLGILFIAIGLLAIGGALVANMIGGRDSGFGPLQKIGVGSGVVIILMAIPLIRLGNKPA